MDGLRIAAVYSLPSYFLGFCGPQDKKSRKILNDFVSGKQVSKKTVKGVFEKFEASYHYYKLIARKNNIPDPFNERVVRAFWLGNSLLEKVGKEDLRKLILTDFCRPGLLTKARAEEKAAEVPKESLPHHSFHVLFLGAITARVRLKGVMLDLCRTGWGEVIQVKREKLIVRYKPLVLGGKIRLGKAIQKNIEWSKSIVPRVNIGDWVSFHWGSVCEVLDKESINNLEFYTKNTIDRVNGQSK